MRQIVLDTETTGMDPQAGHRIIEIGCVEMVNRRLTGNDLHLYLHPDREIDEGAIAVHGITLEFLADKPRFAEVAERLRNYLSEAELIIHNAPFDLAFLNKEFSDFDTAHKLLEDTGTIIDTLVDARKRFPGQRNSLDALCKRFEIDNSGRDLHGALLDAQLLADVYLRMTGGQIDIGLSADSDSESEGRANADLAAYLGSNHRPRVQLASDEELAEHERYLDMLAKAGGGQCLWRALEEQDAG